MAIAKRRIIIIMANVYSHVCGVRESFRKNGRLADAARMRRDTIHLSRETTTIQLRTHSSRQYAINLLSIDNDLLIFY